MFWITALMIPLGMFICVGGTYGVVVEIKEAYASGRIGKCNLYEYLSSLMDVLTVGYRLRVFLRGQLWHDCFLGLR